MQHELEPVPRQAARRLHLHYGDDVTRWLAEVPRLICQAASRRGLTLLGYHDAGHASILVQAVDRRGDAVMVKAIYDDQRLRAEASALSLWNGIHAPLLIGAEPDLGLLLIEMIHPGPGGASPPRTELPAVIQALGRLHDYLPPSTTHTTHLREYHEGEVVPRMLARDRQAKELLPRRWLSVALRLAERLPNPTPEDRLLHGDLYRENVLFDPAGRVVFVDPHAKLGPREYDLAFWLLYYDLFSGLEDRLRLLAEAAGTPLIQVLRWSVLLGVDGLLYYGWSRDEERAARMAAALELLGPLAGTWDGSP